MAQVRCGGFCASHDGPWAWQEVWQMNDGTNDAARPPGHTSRQAAGPRWRAALTTLILLAGCLVSAVVTTTLTSAPIARADTVPPPPAGWTTVFGDNFAGAAGSAPSASNWFYDIG